MTAWAEPCPVPGVGVAAGPDDDADEPDVLGVGDVPDGVAAGELGAVLPLDPLDGVLLVCGDGCLCRAAADQVADARPGGGLAPHGRVQRLAHRQLDNRDHHEAGQEHAQRDPAVDEPLPPADVPPPRAAAAAAAAAAIRGGPVAELTGGMLAGRVPGGPGRVPGGPGRADPALPRAGLGSGRDDLGLGGVRRSVLATAVVAAGAGTAGRPAGGQRLGGRVTRPGAARWLPRGVPGRLARVGLPVPEHLPGGLQPFLGASQVVPVDLGSRGTGDAAHRGTHQGAPDAQIGRQDRAGQRGQQAGDDLNGTELEPARPADEQSPFIRIRSLPSLCAVLHSPGGHAPNWRRAG